MKILRTQDEIMASWKSNLDQPVVSICCITYNHEKFIEETLHGFLIQETDFPIEIIIHDDASTDKTASIIREYEIKYPKIIKPIYQTENQYSKGNRAAMIVYPLCRGKYIAVCEGDDYWCDPNKLSIQANYLDKNQHVVISSHDAFIVNEDGKKIKDSKLPDDHKRDYSDKELMYDQAWLLTMNWMIRNINIPDIPERRMVKNSDNFLISILGAYGGSHHHDDIMPSAYRVHQGGIWSALSTDEKTDSIINTYFWMYKYYKRIGVDECKNVFWNKFISATLSRVSTPNLIITIFKRLIPQPIKKTIRKIIRN
ncbi:glycosyltransferase [Acinetobacter indicus]|uniref:glycosyltransferase n=1 Tax=Acinetobacter indicus TaxID=756892 RepID=UPI0039893F77